MAESHVRRSVNGRLLRRMLLAAALAGIAATALGGAASNGQAAADARADLRNEIATGGLIFAPNLNLEIEQQDVTISADLTQVTYAIRNNDSAAQTIVIAFPLADIDANVPPEMHTEFAVATPANFMDFVITVDGRRPTTTLEQRAHAVGLDVTKAIIDAGLPMFPLSADLAQRISDLDPAVRTDLIERGVLRLDDDQLLPAWTLKTTAHWRQSFPAGQTLALLLAYKPMAGRNPFSSGNLQPLKKAVCVDAAQEQSVMRLASAGAPLTMVSVAYSAHPGAEALGPVGRFRLIVDRATPKSVVATCRQGLSLSGPTTYDWTAINYAVDEDFRVMFVR
jgi:Domain of unknown function (DUF4424)